MRRARNDMSVELRKQKREDHLRKKRNVLPVVDDLEESDSESKAVSIVDCLSKQLKFIPYYLLGTQLGYLELV